MGFKIQDDKKYSRTRTCHLLPKVQTSLMSLEPLSVSGEDYVTVSYIKPMLHHLATEVCLHREEDTQLTSDIKRNVEEYMEKRYENLQTSELLSLASQTIWGRRSGDYCQILSTAPECLSGQSDCSICQSLC